MSGFKTGSAPFKRYQDLADEGFQPVAVGNVANAMVGMQKNDTLYICFLADTEEMQKKRQAALLDHMENDTPPIEIPNVPLLCIKAE